jgi:hypothetical protein
VLVDERGEVRAYFLYSLFVVGMFEGHEEKIGDNGVGGITTLEDRSLDRMDQPSGSSVAQNQDAIA